MLKRNITRILLGALAATSVSCGDVVTSGKSPVYLVIDLLQAAAGGRETGDLAGTLLSDVQTLIIEPEPCSAEAPCPTVFNDVGSVTLRIASKDVTISSPTTNNEVTINRYRVTFRRSDGRNTPGVDVPHPFEGAVTGTVPASGQVTLGFELIRHTAKKEPPLVALISSRTIISTIADVTFFGQDRVGNDISVAGSILVEFGNFGD
jgi:hypothetical protein